MPRSKRLTCKTPAARGTANLLTASCAVRPATALVSHTQPRQCGVQRVRGSKSCRSSCAPHESNTCAARGMSCPTAVRAANSLTASCAVRPATALVLHTQPMQCGVQRVRGSKSCRSSCAPHESHTCAARGMSCPTAMRAANPLSTPFGGQMYRAPRCALPQQLCSARKNKRPLAKLPGRPCLLTEFCFAESRCPCYCGSYAKQSIYLSLN